MRGKIGMIMLWLTLALAGPELPAEDYLPPEINITPYSSSFEQGNNAYYQDISSAVVSIAVTDNRIQDTGINHLYMNINDKSYELMETEEAVDSYNYDLVLKDYMDGSAVYHITVYANDLNDNSSSGEIWIYVDNSAPEFTEAFLGDSKMSTYDMNAEIPALIERDYTIVGGATTLKIIGEDVISGLSDIEYYIEYEGQEYDEDAVPQTNFVNLGINQEGLIDIPDNMVGRIYFRIYDKAGNVSDWITTKSFLSESEEKFLESASIDISLPATDNKDAYGNNLYNSDVKISISLSESFGGIEDGLYEIYRDGNLKETGNLELDNRNYRGNILERCSSDISISDEVNEITLIVKLKAKSGFAIEKSVTFGIDKTEPSVSMHIASGQHDSEYTDYYNTDVGIDFNVEDKNLDTDRICIMKNGSRMTDVGVNRTGNIATGHVDIYDDGQYYIALSATDRAGNESERLEQGFIIDKTGPIIKVSYLDNDTVYFINHERKALVEVIDDNPEPSRIVVSNDSVNSYVLNMETGIQLLFDSDGFYSYHIDATDRAGNRSSTYFETGFVIDTITPSIVISGVNDGDSYNGSLASTISISDINIDTKSVKASLICDDNGDTITLPITYSGGDIILKMEDIPYERSYNGHYTIMAEASDLSGNVCSDSKRFTVNRFGSWYLAGDTVLSYENNYINDVSGIHIYEYNIDKLDERRVDIIYNGEKLELYAEDYTCNIEYNDNCYIYDYYIEDKVFAKDGSYRITTSSVDKAGNINISSSRDNLGNIGFIVDRTSPLITGIDISNGQRIKEKQVPVKFIIRDNSELAAVSIKLNDEILAEYLEDFPADYSFTLFESDMPQCFSVEAIDKAGNVTVIEVKDIIVNITFIYKLLNDYNVLLGSFLDIIGISGLVFVRRKRVIA